MSVKQFTLLRGRTFLEFRLITPKLCALRFDELVNASGERFVTPAPSWRARLNRLAANKYSAALSALSTLNRPRSKTIRQRQRMNMLKNDATELAHIRRTIDDWTAGLRRKSASDVIAQFGQGYVHFSLAPPLISNASDAAGMNRWFETWKGGLGYEFRALDIATHGDLAYAFGLVHLSGTKVGGPDISLWSRLTLCLKRIDGEWKIVHEHESVPFYMDGSYRAAVDLAP
jgi:ketosteroid isomerase-like protein